VHRIGPLPSPRRGTRRQTPGGSAYVRHPGHPGLHDLAGPFAGISTETLVALTAATASMPGSRPSLSAASRLSSETNLCGPAWISTCAITVSRTTRGDQAAEPVPHRLAYHRPALTLVPRFGQVLGEPGQGRPVHGLPPGGIGGGFDPPAIRPAAQGVRTDPEKTGRLLHPERRHAVTLGQAQQTHRAGATGPACAALLGRSRELPGAKCPVIGHGAVRGWLA